MKKQIEAYAESECILEQFLRKELGLTKKQIRQAKYRADGICVNGERSRVTARLKMGDVIHILLEEETQESSQMRGQEGNLQILYEDEDILAVNKMAGMVVHPSHGHFEDSLANLVTGYFRKKNLSVVIRPIGRLDKDTSGIVLFAKNQVAAARLMKQKEAGIFYKKYLALVQGNPFMEKDTICTDLEKEEGSLMKMRVTECGLHAVTHYEVVERYEEYALVKVFIETGRTHQIRVHMASIGYPLLGDQLYHPSYLVNEGQNMTRTALHASECWFCQPFTKEEIHLKTEIPEDMKKFIDRNYG